jgi:hypothetical protein
MAVSYRISLHFSRQGTRDRLAHLERKIAVPLINNLPRQKLPSKKEFPD